MGQHSMSDPLHNEIESNFNSAHTMLQRAIESQTQHTDYSTLSALMAITYALLANKGEIERVNMYLDSIVASLDNNKT